MLFDALLVMKATVYLLRIYLDHDKRQKSEFYDIFGNRVSLIFSNGTTFFWEIQQENGKVNATDCLSLSFFYGFYNF